MKHRQLLPTIIILMFFFIDIYGTDINISDRGAVSDYITDNTGIIQKAIDDCADSGGGSVIIPPGIFLTKELYLRSGVNILLKKNAVLTAHPDLDSYTSEKSPRKALIHALQIENASITGEGILDGNGCLPKHQTGDNTMGRYYTIFLDRCKNMTVKDVTLINSCFWTFRILDCDNVIVSGIRVNSHCNLNNDGIDIDGKNIAVTNCIIDCVDDAICFKSDSKTSICENISVTNCVISTNCNGIKFGTASNMGFRNIVVSNVIIKRPAMNNFHEYKIQRLTGVTVESSVNVGIALEMVDGGIMDQICITGIVMKDVLTPLLIKFGNRKNTPQYCRNIVISDVIASSNSLMTSSITGFPGYNVENVKISNVIFNCPGGGTAENSMTVIQENEKAYPDNRQFGLVMPSYGMFIRHVRNITLDNIQFNNAFPDSRYALAVEDVENMTIDKVNSSSHSSTTPFIKMTDATNTTITGYNSSAPHDIFIRLYGKNSGIKLKNNDFSGIKNVAVTAEGINPGIIQMNNIK